MPCSVFSGAGAGLMSPSWRADGDTQDNLRWLDRLGVILRRRRRQLPFLRFLGQSVANGAHGGGFLFGLCIGYLFYSPRRRYVWAAPFAASASGRLRPGLCLAALVGRVERSGRAIA